MRIGVDLGGTKIEAIALDEHGDILCRHRTATPVGNYDATLNAIAELVLGIEREIGATGSVGIATPGSLSLKTGLIRNSNSTALNGKPLDRDIERILSRPVTLENDANCFALSEAIDGAARDAESVFGVILGTGVGGGLVVRKRVLSGRNRIAGEWGHNPLPWPKPHELRGERCYCGQRGCIETWISGPAIARQFRAATARDLDAIERFEERLARGLAHVINIFDPDAIVLGGGLSNIGRLYENLPRLIPAHVFSDSVDTPILPPIHGDSSGVRGAAWLWPSNPV
jgi:fructokinase